MNVLFTGESWADYLFWQGTDRKMVRKINELIKAIQRTPFQGIGKPERLKHQMAGLWSRRIDLDHWLVYGIRDNDLVIISCRYHYE